MAHFREHSPNPTKGVHGILIEGIWNSGFQNQSEWLLGWLAVYPGSLPFRFLHGDLMSVSLLWVLSISIIVLNVLIWHHHTNSWQEVLKGGIEGKPVPEAHIRTSMLEPSPCGVGLGIWKGWLASLLHSCLAKITSPSSIKLHCTSIRIQICTLSTSP